jgi:hypothetical protein
VISWHKKNPDDWKATWFEIQKKWTDEQGCPDGVFAAFNIDAKVNAAYIVLGLLYGEGDFTKTLDVSTRAGQDSDCNPSSAAGILGTMYGYEKIPAHWKLGLKESEDIDFKYTTISLNDVYRLGLKHTLQNVQRNGGKVSGENVTIKLQDPVPVRFEQSFEGHYAREKKGIGQNVNDEFSIDFEGIGFVLRGEARPKSGSTWDYTGNYVFTTELFIDNKKMQTIKLPVDFVHRRHELFWHYQLAPGKHNVRFKVLNPDPDHTVRVSDLIVYKSSPKD